MRLAIFCWVLFLIFLLWLVYSASSVLIKCILLVVFSLSIVDMFDHYNENKGE